MYCLPFWSTRSEPKVPVQQVPTAALMPEVPSLIGKLCSTWFSRGMTLTVADAVLLGSALEIAEIRKVSGVRTGAGALKIPPLIKPGKVTSPGKSVTDQVALTFVFPRITAV